MQTYDRSKKKEMNLQKISNRITIGVLDLKPLKTDGIG
jgi:hypothetical protein